MSGTTPNFHGVYSLVGRADADHISTQTSDGEEDMGPYASLW